MRGCRAVLVVDGDTMWLGVWCEGGLGCWFVCVTGTWISGWGGEGFWCIPLGGADGWLRVRGGGYGGVCVDNGEGGDNGVVVWMGINGGMPVFGRTWFCSYFFCNFCNFQSSWVF